jgi:hypothetical protein
MPCAWAVKGELSITTAVAASNNEHFMIKALILSEGSQWITTKASVGPQIGGDVRRS